LLELGLQRGIGRLSQAQKKTAFFLPERCRQLVRGLCPKTPINDKNTKTDRKWYF